MYSCGSNGVWQGAFSCRRLRHHYHQKLRLIHFISSIALDCGQHILGLDPNAVDVVCASTTLGSTCTTQCQTGFVGGPATYTCTIDGLWTGQLICPGESHTLSINIMFTEMMPSHDSMTGIDCGRDIASLPGNATARCRGLLSTSSSQPHFEPHFVGNTAFQGTNCVAKCATGFEPVSGINAATYYCSSSGVWTLQSAPISCRRLLI